MVIPRDGLKSLDLYGRGRDPRDDLATPFFREAILLLSKNVAATTISADIR